MHRSQDIPGLEDVKKIQYWEDYLVSSGENLWLVLTAFAEYPDIGETRNSMKQVLLRIPVL